MIFRQIEEILAGRKTQTRRVVKPGEVLIQDVARGDDGYGPLFDAVVFRQGEYPEPITDRLKWQVGRTYAVIPKRGQPALWWRPPGPDDIYESAFCIGKPDDADPLWQPLRIRITAIRQERLQDISEDDVEAEGCALQAWAGDAHHVCPHTAGYAALWESINGAGSWNDNQLVWVLTFRVVQ